MNLMEATKESLPEKGKGPMLLRIRRQILKTGWTRLVKFATYQKATRGGVRLTISSTGARWGTKKRKPDVWGDAQLERRKHNILGGPVGERGAQSAKKGRLSHGGGN